MRLEQAELAVTLMAAAGDPMTVAELRPGKSGRLRLREKRDHRPWRAVIGLALDQHERRLDLLDVRHRRTGGGRLPLLTPLTSQQ